MNIRSLFIATGIASILSFASFASAQSSLDSYFDFQVKGSDSSVDAHYNESADTTSQKVKLPANLSKWTCLRQPLHAAPNNVVSGTVVCTDDAGKSAVAVVASCKQDAPNASSNAMVLANDKGMVIIRVSCKTVPHQSAPSDPGGTVNI